VSFESADGAFLCVATVAVRRYQLIIHVIGGEHIIQSGRSLVVESLELWFEDLEGEFLMEGIICLDPFLGVPGFHMGDFNVVAVINIADYDI
jgi:hypothetical protein